ncbi:MAG: FAD-dependent oxidoreductase [Actinomycetia bacterium]|nr:FAD-dependent oxidoreductase [Actinomycetes bacterium]MCP4962182.1 FAD-dependent oxidoreductase [Actinomycetes bacterium]
MVADPLSFYDENIPCLAACPVHTNAGMYVAAIADGDDELAYLTARLPNPFASVCGRVCAAPCEEACRRGTIDRPIAIRALKRFVTEQYGPESRSAGDDGPAPWDAVVPAPAEDRPQHIAVVGGGPAGMAAAHDLRRLGYGVTVYEATDKLGGATWLGIPEYRLNRSVLAGDMQAIIDLGVEVRYNTRMGEDITLDQLRHEYDAVFLSIGATLGRGLPIEGAEADGVYKAIEFLIAMNRGMPVDVGERVLVVGGGDVAMDAARTALRADVYGGNEQASTSGTARKVRVMSLESREEMPAHDFEVEEATEEGIEFSPRRGPKRVLTRDGAVVGMETVGVTSVFDEEGRFAPTFDDSDLTSFEADTIVLAIGQAIDLEALGDEGPEVSPRRTIDIDWDTGATSLDGVWSGGDAAKGPRTLIDAVADGRRSAADIHRSFGGGVKTETPGKMVKLRQFHRLDDHYDRIDRTEVPTIPSDRRIGLTEVETGFTEEQARCEASRCLRCFANILLEPEKCVLCALCADVCPVDVISLIPANEVDPSLGPDAGTALLLDEERCIRCAMCVERCPPNALSVGMWTGTGVPK